jgi:predicted 2-oxoglutarate/Fe(II)-dependent dioxygenase YbiX
MLRNQLLAQAGVFFRPHFLTQEQCAQLRAAMQASPAEPATVYVGKDEARVDERQRRTLSTEVGVDIADPIDEALDGLRPTLEAHFGMALGERERSYYLLYGPGSFFRPHRDRRARTLEEVDERPGPDRRISVVVLLNGPDGGGDHGFGGGELRFFPLMTEPGWQDVGIACDAEAGLLIAFRADVIHEVTEVTKGQRCSIATWFA